MAETYGVYDLRAIPPQTAAVLAQGLRADARIMRLLAERSAAGEASNGFETPEAFLAARDIIMKGG